MPETPVKPLQNRWYVSLQALHALFIVFCTGPAKVYTLRGKYRQIILRVSADNADETQSSNVIVSADRTLQVVVELVGPSLPNFFELMRHSFNQGMHPHTSHDRSGLQLLKT